MGGGNRQGSYSVNLPDGRIQHVNYHTNDLDGYVAEVIYDGTPAYPDVVGGVTHEIASPVAHAVASPLVGTIGNGFIGGHGALIGGHGGFIGGRGGLIGGHGALIGGRRVIG